MTAEEDFFGIDDDALQRDGYGRPLLIPHGSTDGKKVPYTRASSYAEKINDRRYLHRWEQRYLARAMAENDDLRLLAAGEVYTTGFDHPDDDLNRDSGYRLDEIITRGLDRMGIHVKADFGTAVHSFATNLDHPNPLPESPSGWPSFEAHVAGYRAELAARGFEVYSSEQFTACDAVMAAGTFDGTYLTPEWGPVVGDLKTGKNKVGFAVQTAIYANGVLYHPKTDTRSPIHPELNREVGLIFLVTEAGTETKKVDLVLAWQLTLHIRAIFEDFKASALYEKLPPVLTLLDRIGQTQNIAELQGLWRETKDQWQDVHVDAANARKELL